MIFEPSTSGIWPAEALAGVLPSDLQNAAPAATSVSAEDTQPVELATPHAWSRLIREISNIAEHSGGHLLIHCVRNDGTAGDAGTDFYLRIPEEHGPNQNDAAPGSSARTGANLQPVRIVTDPNALALQPPDVDRLYPWRQKDLLRELNRRLGRRLLNSYDIQAIRRQHRLDEHPEYVFNLPGAGRRYSPAVADWIVEEYSRDPEFFRRARLADHDLMALRRRKPR